MLVNRKIPLKIFFHCQPSLPYIKFYDPTKIFPELYFFLKWSLVSSQRKKQNFNQSFRENARV